MPYYLQSVVPHGLTRLTKAPYVVRIDDDFTAWRNVLSATPLHPNQSEFALKPGEWVDDPISPETTKERADAEQFLTDLEAQAKSNGHNRADVTMHRDDHTLRIVCRVTGIATVWLFNGETVTRAAALQAILNH